MIDMITYIALLRGINIGGHHKVPMAELKKVMAKMGLANPRTLLNSGNAVFESYGEDVDALRERIESQLTGHFGFPVPVILKRKDEITAFIEKKPFESINITPDIRLYVTFLKNEPRISLALPWTSPDNSFRIIAVNNKIVCSVLDLAVTNTPKGMEELEKMFGKEITSRNWNTILKLADL